MKLPAVTVAATLLASTVASAVAFGETPPAGSAARPAPPAEEVAAAYAEAARKVVAMAEDYPEAKYDFKPTPEVRSFAEQILHVAGDNVQFVEAARSGKFNGADPSRATYKTKAQIVAFLKKSVADDLAYMKSSTAPLKSPWSPKMVSAQAYWYDAVVHLAEHYGQLVFYYRMNKMVPPESRPKK